MIEIALFKDRSRPGSIWCHDGQAVVAGPFECLGKADNLAAARQGNPSRDPSVPFGDTPTGTYKGTVLGKQKDSRTYGTTAVISMDPLEGQALQAKKNGRTGLWIHGGAPAKNGGLRPTYGCVRVADTTMDKILAVLPKTDITITIKEV